MTRKYIYVMWIWNMFAHENKCILIMNVYLCISMCVVACTCMLTSHIKIKSYTMVLVNQGQFWAKFVFRLFVVNLSKPNCRAGPDYVWANKWKQKWWRPYPNPKPNCVSWCDTCVRHVIKTPPQTQTPEVCVTRDACASEHKTDSSKKTAVCATSPTTVTTAVGHTISLTVQ